MATINTNVAAQMAANALAKNDRAMTQTMERLATGKRINSASDDAAGLAIASKLTAQVTGLNQAVRNGNDAISMLQTADGAMIEVSNMLQRMRELSVQGGNGTLSSTDRAALNTEFVALRTEIERIADNTQWNGDNLLDGSAGSFGLLTFQVGYEADQTITVNVGDLELAAGAEPIQLAPPLAVFLAPIFPLSQLPQRPCLTPRSRHLIGYSRARCKTCDYRCYSKLPWSLP